MTYFKHESALRRRTLRDRRGHQDLALLPHPEGRQNRHELHLRPELQRRNDVVIGNNVKVQNNVSIYTGTVIEDDVFLGPRACSPTSTNPRSQVNRHSLYEKTLLRRGCSIGANATIVCGVDDRAVRVRRSGRGGGRRCAGLRLDAGRPCPPEGLGEPPRPAPLREPDWDRSTPAPRAACATAKTSMGCFTASMSARTKSCPRRFASRHLLRRHRSRAAADVVPGPLGPIAVL